MIEKKSGNRSSSYPSISLEEALKKLSTLKDSHGVNGEYDREATAKGMGYSSLNGSSARAVAALVQYGLLSRSKDMYMISELAKEYLMPIEDGQAKAAVKRAALQPNLIKKIYDEYKGQPLPGQLKNILTITYNVQSPVADAALRVIKQSLRVGGLLSEDGVVLDEDEVVVDDTESAVKDAIESYNPTLSENQITKQDTLASESVIGTSKLGQTINSTEQGINLVGDGWQLTVLLKTTKRHNPDTRKLVRGLLEVADEVADALYAEDREG